MEYKSLEDNYKRIFDEKVLPFINKNIEKDFYSIPVYYLLEGLNINRFRGSLPIIIAKEYGKNEDFMLPLSAFCELTFTTAMAQDDYYDDDEFREDLIATHRKFGIKETLLSCEYVNHKAIFILLDSLIKNNLPKLKYDQILKIVLSGMEAWYSSVIMEINSKKDLFSIDEEYLRGIYLNKTIHGRILLECSFLIVQDDEKIIRIIREYSEHLAIAGQLKNDIYDFVKHQKYRGFSDLRQGHITWPLFLLIKSLKENEKNDFLEDLHNKRYERLIGLFKEKMVIEKTLKLIDFHVIKAKELIKNKFPKNIGVILETWAEGNMNFSKEPKL